MTKSIVNADELSWQLNESGDYEHFDKTLRKHTDGKKLGTSLYKLMPGKKAFPYHCHFANEEAVFILEGEGSVRINGEIFPIKKHDYLTFPAGPDHAHQIINTSTNELIFLCFSTMVHPEVCYYPDSNKISVTAGAAPGSDQHEVLLRTVLKLEDEVDYFHGE